MVRFRLMLLTFSAAALLSLPVAFAETAAPAAETPAAAQAAPAPTAKPAPRDLSKYKEEKVPGGTLMFIAYMVMWGLVAGMVARTVLRQSKVEAELTELSERVDVISQEDGGTA